MIYRVVCYHDAKPQYIVAIFDNEDTANEFSNEYNKKYEEHTKDIYENEHDIEYHVEEEQVLWKKILGFSK